MNLKNLVKLSELTNDQITQLFAQNRKETMPEMEQALKDNKCLICSRYAFSGAAYSSDICKYDKGILIPDLIIYLKHFQWDKVQQRYSGGTDRYEKLTYQKQVQNRFDELFYSHQNIKIGEVFEIDSDQEIEVIQQKIREKIDQKLKFLKTQIKFGLFEEK